MKLNSASSFFVVLVRQTAIESLFDQIEELRKERNELQTWKNEIMEEHKQFKKDMEFYQLGGVSVLFTDKHAKEEMAELVAELKAKREKEYEKS